MSTTTSVSYTGEFLDLPAELADPAQARYVVIPVPYDGTSTWRKGADRGPAALLEASGAVEWYDIETQLEACQAGILTAPALEVAQLSPEAMSELPGLEMLRLHSNCLVTADDVRHLQPLKKLLRLTLMNNPLDATREYRLHMIAHLPTLKMFDNVVITQSERHKVEGFNRRFAKRGSPQH